MNPSGEAKGAFTIYCWPRSQLLSFCFVFAAYAPLLYKLLAVHATNWCTPSPPKSLQDLASDTPGLPHMLRSCCTFSFSVKRTKASPPSLCGPHGFMKYQWDNNKRIINPELLSVSTLLAPSFHACFGLSCTILWAIYRIVSFIDRLQVLVINVKLFDLQ